MKIQQSAFANPDIPFLKGALHVHTTRSEREETPEETLKLHSELGYQFVAITDHRKNNASQFSPKNVIVIQGVETDWRFPDKNGEGERVYHTVCIGSSVLNGYTHDELLSTVSFTAMIAITAQDAECCTDPY